MDNANEQISYSADERRRVEYNKNLIRIAKKALRDVENDRKTREKSEAKKAAEDRIAKFKMDAARERFRVGYRKLMLDAKNTARAYNLTVLEAKLVEQGLDTATIMLKVQRLP